MFMHNGLVGNWPRVRRRVEALIPDALYPSRVGTTDSEALFLAIMGAGGDTDPIGATARVLAQVGALMSEEGYKDRLRFTAALSDGQNLYAFRHSVNDKPNTLYYSAAGKNVLLVSEPLDSDGTHWQPVPPASVVIARHGKPIEILPFLAELQQVAAE
jgi:glutamine amidotransferase